MWSDSRRRCVCPSRRLTGAMEISAAIRRACSSRSSMLSSSTLPPASRGIVGIRCLNAGIRPPQSCPGFVQKHSRVYEAVLLDRVQCDRLFLQDLQKSLREKTRVTGGRASDHETVVVSPRWHSPCSWAARALRRRNTGFDPVLDVVARPTGHHVRADPFGGRSLDPALRMRTTDGPESVHFVGGRGDRGVRGVASRAAAPGIPRRGGRAVP